MFQELWAHSLEHAQAQAKVLKAQLIKIDGQVSQLLTRILATSVPSVIGAYEEKVRGLENDKLPIKDRLASSGRPVSSFDDTLRTALAFTQTLANSGVRSGWRTAAPSSSSPLPTGCGTSGTRALEPQICPCRSRC